MVEKIENSCFADSQLEEFTAPESLREIGELAFMNCKHLRHVKLNESL